MIKKFSAVVLAVVIAAGALCGCSKKEVKKDKKELDSVAASSSQAGSAADDANSTEVPEAKLVIDGEEMDTDGLVVCTIDGIDVDFDTFRYYFYYTVNQITQNYGATLDNIKESQEGYDALLENTITNIKQEYVTYRLCKENGIELTEEDKTANEQTYNNAIEQAGSEEEFDNILKSAYLTRDVYKKMLDNAALYAHTESELLTNEGVYATSKEDFRKIVQDPEQYACLRSILVPYCCKAELDDSQAADFESQSLSEKYNAKQLAYAGLEDDKKEEVKAAAKEQADACMQKVKDGEDFEKLIETYNWDPGQEASPDGYYVTPNSNFVEEYLDAGFKLKEGEVSDLVENDSYGWFIIKRMPIDMDYVEENIESMIVDYDLPSRQKLYTDIMEDMEVTYADFYDKITPDSIS